MIQGLFTKFNEIYGSPPGVRPVSNWPRFPAFGTPGTTWRGFFLWTLRQIEGIVAQLYTSIGDCPQTTLERHSIEARTAKLFWLGEAIPIFRKSDGSLTYYINTIHLVFLAVVSAIF